MNARASIALLCALLAWPAAADAQWREGPPLDDPVHDAAAAAANGSVYIGGGAGLLAPRDTFSVLEPGAAEWTALESMPDRLAGHAMAVLDGVVYVAGGERGRAPATGEAGRRGRIEIGVPEAPEGPSARVWTYDPAAQAWGEAPSMPAPRSGFSLTALDGRLYASGGGRLVAFDPRAGAWTDLGPEPAGAGRTAAAIGGRLYLIGGGGAAAGAPGARVDIYDPATETWSRGPDLPSARAGHAVASAGGVIHVVGGRDAEDETLAEHLVLGGAGWTLAEPLQSPRAGAAAAALADGRVVVAGGGYASGFFAAFTSIDAVDIYHPSGH